MLSNHPHRPPQTSARLIAAALAVSALVHIWLLSSSVPDWTKVRLPEPTTLSVQLAPAPSPTAPPEEISPQPEQTTPEPAVTPPRRPPGITHRPPVQPRPAQPPREARSTVTPPADATPPPETTVKPVEQTRPQVLTKPPEPARPNVQSAQPNIFNQPRTPTRQPRSQRTPSGGGVSMDNIRSQLAGGVATAGDNDDSAPKGRFGKIQMVYRTSSCSGSCAGYAATVFARLNRSAGGTRAQMANGEVATTRLTAVIGPDGSVRSVYVAKGSGNSSVDSNARAQTQGASLPPFPADMAARASSLRLTFSWQSSQITQ